MLIDNVKVFLGYKADCNGVSVWTIPVYRNLVLQGFAGDELDSLLVAPRLKEMLRHTLQCGAVQTGMAPYILARMPGFLEE